MDSSKLRRRVGRPAFVAIGVAILLVSSVIQAFASHPEASLPGSNFEIDVDANLKVDDTAPPSLDWANVTEARATDKVNGTGDDSYAGGVKEDTVCPGATTDSIPPNKSDLLSFQVYRELPTATGPQGYLNLAWTRVSDPTGTTLMDFEFNQSGTKCTSGPNVVRTTGDLLIEYAIDQGGSRADITGRFWNGSAWGPTSDLDVNSPTCGGNPCATGTINSSPIPAAESDGLILSGSKSARTFGEAQIDLRFLFQPNKCASIGSAMLKSRSSDSFTSQLKDFVAPVPVNITNCGKVIIRKQTDPQLGTNSPDFGYTKAFGTDPATSNTFSLKDDGVQTFNNVLFGSSYTVDETTIPNGWDFVNVNCSASTGVTPTINGSLVTFAIDDANDVLDCTYNNQSRGTIIVEKITDDGQGAFDFTSNTLSPSPFTLTTTAAGAAGKDSETFGNLTPGTYDVAETVPAGWNLVSATCSDGSDPASIGLSGGETVTCTFHDARERGAIEITKTRKHAGVEDQPHAGVTFTVTGGDLPAAGVTVVTNDQGIACVDNLVVSSLVGNYTVTETVPDGYHVVGSATQTGIVVPESTCSNGPAKVSFENMPLTNVSISVDSQVDGGTASTVDCDNNALDGSSGANGDVTTSATNQEPQVIHCTITIDP
jgi:hypothetical protein